MLIPCELKIGGHVFTVSLTDAECTPALGGAGEVHHAKKVIVISTVSRNEPRSESAIAEALLHEIFHAVACECHEELEEPTVARLATGLFAVLRNNSLDFHAPDLAGTVVEIDNKDGNLGKIGNIGKL